MDLGDGGRVEFQERYTKKAVWALKQEESDMTLHLKAIGEKLEALMGEIKDDREATKKAISRENARPTLWKDARETDRHWGRLCSVEGRTLECLGKARLTVTLGTRVIEWSFIVAEIGDDEGILGNDFTMAHELTVRPCEGAVYLPDLPGTGKGHMGERLPCTIRSVTEVRAVTEETLVVRAVGSATLAPHTVTQVRVIVPTPRARGTVMIDPGPLGLCPVRGIVEVEQDSSIWLANTGSQPIQIDKDEVVAMAECVLAEPGASAGNDRDYGDEVNGLVE